MERVEWMEWGERGDPSGDFGSSRNQASSYRVELTAGAELAAKIERAREPESLGSC